MAKHRSQPVAFCILPLILYPYTTNTSHITVLCGKPQIATGCVLYFATNSLAFCILLQHITRTYKKEPVNPDFCGKTQITHEEIVNPDLCGKTQIATGCVLYFATNSLPLHNRFTSPDLAGKTFGKRSFLVNLAAAAAGRDTHPGKGPRDKDLHSMMNE